MIISMEEREKIDNVGEKPFKFEVNCLEEEQCREVVLEAWVGANEEEGGCSIAHALKSVAGSLQEWSSNVLGDLEKRLKKVNKDLEACREGNDQ